MDERIYRLLLRLYPRAHRDAYEEPMVQGFRDLRREATRRGPWALLPFWARIYSDTVASAWRERANRPVRFGRTAKLIGFGLFIFMLLNVHGLADRIFIILNRDADGVFSYGRGNVLYWLRNLLQWHPAFYWALWLAGLALVYAALHSKLSAAARLGFTGLSLAVPVWMFETLFGIRLPAVLGEANTYISWLGSIVFGAAALSQFRISTLDFGRVAVAISGTIALVRMQISWLSPSGEVGPAYWWIFFDVERVAFYLGWLLIAVSAHRLVVPKRSAPAPARIERWTGD